MKEIKQTERSLPDGSPISVFQFYEEHEPETASLEELLQQRDKLKQQVDALNKVINKLKLDQIVEKEILRHQKELARECSLDVKEEIWYSILAGRYNVQETGCSFHCITHEISTEKYKVEITLKYSQDLLEFTLDEFLKQQVKFVHTGEEDAD